MVHKYMRLMHNGYDGYASRETAQSRPEPPDYICGDCGGEEHYGGGIATTAEPAGGKQSVAAGTRDVSG
jgi:hypothetical protein